MANYSQYNRRLQSWFLHGSWSCVSSKFTAHFQILQTTKKSITPTANDITTGRLVVNIPPAVEIAAFIMIEIVLVAIAFSFFYYITNFLLAVDKFVFFIF